MAPQEAEALFNRALAEEQAGHFDGAIAAFRTLRAGAPTPRVELELARALLAHGKAEEALGLFKEIYLDKTTPLAVKRNVLPFIQKARLQLGLPDFGLNLVSTNNPAKVSGPVTLWFGGTPLSYVAPQKPEFAYGAEPYVGWQREFGDDLLASARLSGRFYEQPTLDTGSLQLSLARRLPWWTGWYGKVSAEGWLQQGASYAYSAIDTWKVFSAGQNVQLGAGLQAGWMAQEVNGASGPLGRPYMFAAIAVTPDLSGFGRLSLERLAAQNAYYSYTAPKAETGLEISAGSMTIAPSFSVSWSHGQQYDPFWGVTHRDVTMHPELKISDADFEYNGVRPELTVFYEQRTSNVPINVYHQFGAMIGWRKLF